MTTELNLKDRLNNNVDKAQKQWNAFTVRTSELFETGNARWKELSQQLSIAALFDRLNINQTDLSTLESRVNALEAQVAELVQAQTKKPTRKPRAKKKAAVKKTTAAKTASVQ